MIDSLTRIRRLAGLLVEAEPPHILTPEEMDAQDDAQDDARRAREARIVILITRAFKRLGIALGDDLDGSPVFYSEDDREATVQLDDSSIDVDLLVKLKQSGLSDRYVVQIGTDHVLDIVFTVSAALDHAR